MIKMLTTLFLVLVFLNCMADEKPSILLEQTEANEENPFGQNAIDGVRALVKVYLAMTNDEKMEFLSNEGLSEEAFNILVARSHVDWKTEGKHKLLQSNSTISLPTGHALVVGSDAVAFFTIEGRPADEHIEAYVCDCNNFDSSVVFHNFKTGYISINDWNEIDQKGLLDRIIQSTEEDNKKWRKKGIDELHVTGWIQEPTLDKYTNTVYWAIEGYADGNESFINSVAIRLGREGYEMITWVTSKSSYVPFGGQLDVMLRAHSFDPGYRYNDYKTGDKVAGYGIAALVAATVSGKIVKVGGVAVLFKKLSGLFLAVIAVLFYKFKNIFKRNKDR